MHKHFQNMKKMYGLFQNYKNDKEIYFIEAELPSFTPSIKREIPCKMLLNNAAIIVDQKT